MKVYIAHVVTESADHYVWALAPSSGDFVANDILG